MKPGRITHTTDTHLYKDDTVAAAAAPPCCALLRPLPRPPPPPRLLVGTIRPGAAVRAEAAPLEPERAKGSDAVDVVAVEVGAGLGG